MRDWVEHTRPLARWPRRSESSEATLSERWCRWTLFIRAVDEMRKSNLRR